MVSPLGGLVVVVVVEGVLVLGGTVDVVVVVVGAVVGGVVVEGVVVDGAVVGGVVVGGTVVGGVVVGGVDGPLLTTNPKWPLQCRTSVCLLPGPQPLSALQLPTDSTLSSSV